GQPWFSWTNLANIPAGFADGVDNDTTYSAGTGLALAGTVFNVTFGTNGVATSAARSDHNHVGQSWLNWTNLSGIPASVSNGYTAGAGLLLAGNQFSVSFGANGAATTAARSDHNHFGQSSFSWTNLANIPAGFADGVDNDTTYSAGTGLALAGTVFNVTFGTNGT